jgi:mercuric ion transport protein
MNEIPDCIQPKYGSAIASAGAGVTAALGAFACCTGPLLLASLGVAGAGAAAALRPYRFVFVLTAAALLYWAFHKLERAEARCEADGGTCKLAGRRRTRIVLWACVVLAMILATSPRWDDLFF